MYKGASRFYQRHPELAPVSQQKLTKAEKKRKAAAEKRKKNKELDRKNRLLAKARRQAATETKRPAASGSRVANGKISTADINNGRPLEQCPKCKIWFGSLEKHRDKCRRT